MRTREENRKYMSTPRRTEVATLKLMGLDDKEIAERLGIARATVRSLRSPAHGRYAKGCGKGWHGWKRRGELPPL